jgi:hypothetical protein
MVITSFTITPDQYEWLQREAIRMTGQTQTRIGMSDIIRACLASMMEQTKAATNAHTDTQ